MFYHLFASPLTRDCRTDIGTRKPTKDRSRRRERRLLLEPLEDRRVLASSLGGWDGWSAAGSDATASLVQRAEAGQVLRVIVQADDTDAALALSAQASEHGATIVHQFDRFPLIVMEVNTSALQGLLASPLVVSLGEDGLLAPTLDNSLPVINAPEVHSLGGDGTGITVAVLDTGIDRNHPFFGDRVVEEACYSNSSGCLNGTSNMCTHGPHVAGIAAGDGPDLNNAPASGVAPGADIIAVQVFTRYDTSEACNPNSAPCLRASFSDLIRGLERVLELSETRTVAAANMSLAGNIATIVAAGNFGKLNEISIPACISSAISVGSTNNSDNVSSFSNRGPLLDLFAPGEGIRSAVETASDYGEIRGFKWHDINGNGVWDTGEPPLAGWEIYLDLNDNRQWDEGEPKTVTGADGSYAFTGVPAGTYTVAEVMQEGWEQTSPGPVAPAGGSGQDEGDDDYAQLAQYLAANLTTIGSTVPMYGTGNLVTSDDGIFQPPTAQSGPLINLDAFRADLRFADITGQGHAIVVLDSGLNLTHPFFGDRIVYYQVFTGEGTGAQDGHGHGTNVTSIATSQDATYPGVAPGVNTIHLKVLRDDNSGSFSWMEQALQWVVANAAIYNIAADPNTLAVGAVFDADIGPSVEDVNFGNWNSNEITVTTFDDIINPNDGLISLREAVLLANGAVGDITIVLDEGTYTLTIEGADKDQALTGDLDILPGRPVTIRGAGAGQTTINTIGRFTDRVFQVLIGAELHLEGLTVTGGNVQGNGGGIFIQGTLTLQDVLVSGNVARRLGGAIHNRSELAAFHSTFYGNRADSDAGNNGEGGGISMSTGSMELHHTIVAGNLQGTGNVAQDLSGTVQAASSFNLIGDAGSAGGLTDSVNGNMLGKGGTGFPRVLGSRIDIDAFEFLPPPVEATRIDVTIVAQPSAIDDHGEVGALPNSADWVHEWQLFWVEIWLSTPDATVLGVAQASVDSLYAANYLTAQQIEYGPAFTLDQTGEIEDASGRVSNLGPRTNRTDVGDDGYVLLARVQFASTEGDQVPVDQAGWNIGPYNMEFVLANGQTQLVGDVTIAPELGSMPGTELWAVAYDMDDNHEIDFGDLSFFAAAFGRLVNESNPAPPYAWWADFDKSARVDFGDLAFFAPNFGKSREQVQAGTQVPTFPASFPAAWRGPSGLGDGGESEGSNVLAGSRCTPRDEDTTWDEAGAAGDWQGMADGEAASPTVADTGSVGIQAVAVQTPSPRNSKELPSGLESVERGSAYFVEIWVQDRVEPGAGISGGTVDVNYVPSLVQAQGLVNLDFNLFSSGTIDAADGVVRNLGGGLLQAGLGVAPQWARLAYVEILAASSGEASFQVSPGAGQFSRYGQGNVAWDLVRLGAPIVVQQIGGHWQNPSHPYDVNDDGLITPLDALVTINDINWNDIRELPVPDPTSQQPPPYFDVSGDDWLTPQDVLLVVNYLNLHGPGPIPTGSGAAALAGLADGGLVEGESPPDLAILERISDSWLFADLQPADFHDHRLAEVSRTATAQRTYTTSSEAQPLEHLLDLLADRSMPWSQDDNLAPHDALFTAIGR